jgi:hypothetical protein
MTASGRIQLTPVWCNHDGTHVNLNSVKGRVKDRNMRERPDIALLLLNPENPYHWMSINGRVVDIVDEDDPARGHLATENIDDLAELYVNQRPYPFRDPKGGEIRVLYKLDLRLRRMSARPTTAVDALERVSWGRRGVSITLRTVYDPVPGRLVF